MIGEFLLSHSPSFHGFDLSLKIVNSKYGCKMTIGERACNCMYFENLFVKSWKEIFEIFVIIEIFVPRKFLAIWYTFIESLYRFEEFSKVMEW